MASFSQSGAYNQEAFAADKVFFCLAQQWSLFFMDSANA